jgi:hypothetical protein
MEWATDGSLDNVERWVRDRSEMIHVNVVDLATYRPPTGTAHFHIYVVNDGHPAAPQWRRRAAREAVNACFLLQPFAPPVLKNCAGSGW